MQKHEELDDHTRAKWRLKYHRGLKRRNGESYKEYKRRQREENEELELYLQGRNVKTVPRVKR